MLSYGCTRLEIGLQSIYEDVARDTNRGHTVAAVGDCFHLAKNAGFKVIAHLMPDLPNMGWERDMESFREFFENPDFRTDGLKVCTAPASITRTMQVSTHTYVSQAPCYKGLHDGATCIDIYRQQALHPSCCLCIAFWLPKVFCACWCFGSLVSLWVWFISVIMLNSS